MVGNAIKLQGNLLLAESNSDNPTKVNQKREVQTEVAESEAKAASVCVALVFNLPPSLRLTAAPRFREYS